MHGGIIIYKMYVGVAVGVGILGDSEACSYSCK